MGFQPVAETPGFDNTMAQLRHFLPQLLRGRLPKLGKGGRSSGGDPANQYPGMENRSHFSGRDVSREIPEENRWETWGNTPFVSYKSQHILDWNQENE